MCNSDIESFFLIATGLGSFQLFSHLQDDSTTVNFARKTEAAEHTLKRDQTAFC